MFDGEHGIALHATQGNRASSPFEGEVSWFFLSYGGNLVYILELRREWSFKTHVCSATAGLLSSYKGQLRNLQEAWRGNTEASRGQPGDPDYLSICPSDIGFPINYQDESSIVTF